MVESESAPLEVDSSTEPARPAHRSRGGSDVAEKALAVVGCSLILFVAFATDIFPYKFGTHDSNYTNLSNTTSDTEITHNAT